MQLTLKFLGIILVSAGFVLCEVQQLHPNTNHHQNRGHGKPQHPHIPEPEAIPMPQVPMPSCGHSFPGSPEWRACFDKFHENMRTFQSQMQAYSQQVVQQAAISAHAAANSQSPHGHHVQATAQNSHHTSTFSSQGYSVKTSGISISSVKHGSTMTIKLLVGPFHHFQTRTEGNEIIMDMKSKDGVQKYASLKLPEGVTQKDLKVERTENTITITGPVKNHQHGGVSSSHSSIFAGNGVNFANFGGQWNTAGFPPVPSPGIIPPMPFIGVPNLFPPMWFF